MLTRFLPVVRLANQQTRYQAVRCLADHAPAHFRTEKEIVIDHKTSMDNHPVPEGSWKEHYDKRNSKWNLMIAANSVFLAATLFVMYQTGCFYLHERPPKTD